MPLSRRIELLAFKYKLQSGAEPTLLLIPKRRDFVKKFAADLVAEVGEENTGSVPYVFDTLWHGKREAHFCGLSIHTYDGDDLAVGASMH